MYLIKMQILSQHQQLQIHLLKMLHAAERSSDTCSKISGADILQHLIITCLITSDTKIFGVI